MESFAELIQSEKPVLVDFYADWCGPCKTVAPVLEELSNEYDGKLLIYKVDTDAEEELSAVFELLNIDPIHDRLVCKLNPNFLKRSLYLDQQYLLFEPKLMKFIEN